MVRKMQKTFSILSFPFYLLINVLPAVNAVVGAGNKIGFVLYDSYRKIGYEDAG